MKVCRHCGEPIMMFHWRDEGDQWWHANVNRGYVEHPPGTEHIKAPAYRRCYADPAQPYAEPAQ
jgi:hypothetical protein